MKHRITITRIVSVTGAGLLLDAGSTVVTATEPCSIIDLGVNSKSLPADTPVKIELGAIGAKTMRPSQRRTASASTKTKAAIKSPDELRRLIIHG